MTKGDVLLVGERINAQGSRRARRLLTAADYDGIVVLAGEQLADGAGALDVCVAAPDNADEAAVMAAVVGRLSEAVSVPLLLDTMRADVVQRALPFARGRGIVNSVHLEDGGLRIADTMPAVLSHGAGLVALCIDSEGMAMTAARKLEVAQSLYRTIVHEHGLSAASLLLDPLTFPLSDRRPERIGSAKATMDGVRLIRAEFPETRIVLGISDVSFGLPPAVRGLVDSVFLHHCAQAGVDTPIVDPARISGYAAIPVPLRRLAEDLLFDESEGSAAVERFVAGCALTHPASS